MTTSVNRTVFELGANNAKYDRAMRNSAKATGKFSKENKSLVSSIALIDGPLGGVASRASNLNSIINSGAGAFAGLAVGLSAVGFGAVKLASVMGELEVEMGKTNALLQTTRGSSGLLSEDLDKMARDVARSTLASTTQIRQAINSLLTFTAVGSDIFGDVISLSQDMVAIWGGSAATNARKLGKALDDPVRQISRLETTVGAFNSESREMIINLAKQGDLAASQALIIKELESRIGNAGEGANSGLFGAVDRLGQAWDELFEGIDKAINASKGLTSFINSTAGLLEDVAFGLNVNFSDDDQSKRLRLSMEIVELEEKLAELQERAEGNVRNRGKLNSDIARTKIRIKDLEKQFNDLLKKGNESRAEALEIERRLKDEEQAKKDRQEEYNLLLEEGARLWKSFQTTLKETEDAEKDLRKIINSGLTDLEKENQLHKDNLRLIREAKGVLGNSPLVSQALDSETTRNRRSVGEIEFDERSASLSGLLGNAGAETRDQEIEQYQNRLNIIEEFRQKDIANQQAADAMMEKEKQRHSKAMQTLEEMEAKNKQKAQEDFWNNAQSLMNSKSRTLFEIGKVAAISRAVLSATETIPHAYKWGTEIGGPVLGAAFAATAALATATQIQQIKATEYGSDSVPTSNGTQSTPEFVPFEDTRREVVINFNGDISGIDAEQIATTLRDYIDGTDFVLVSPDSRNGQELA